MKSPSVAPGEHYSQPENGDCRIRPYVDADAAALRECMVHEQNALRELDARMPDGLAMVDAYFAQTMEACRERDGVILVATVGVIFAGFVTLLRCIPNSGADVAPGAYAAIMDLAVTPEWRGRGIGTALLKEAESNARQSGASELRLHVLGKNQRAMKLYERLGYPLYTVTLAKLLVEQSRESSSAENGSRDATPPIPST